MKGDACFHCGQQGHWVRDCPSKSHNRKSVSSTSADGLDLPRIRCPCGHGYCLVRTSHTVKNPDRKFYTCPAVNGNKCDFFKWCDQVPKSPPQSEYPRCSCGAGDCLKITAEGGPNAGRSCFVCPIKKGHGACRFLQWEGTQEITTINDLFEQSNNEISAKATPRSHQLASDLGDLSIEKSERMKFESLEMENAQHFPTVVAVEGLFEKEQEPLLHRVKLEETSDDLTPAECVDPSNVEASLNLQDLFMMGAESRGPIVKKPFLISQLTAWVEIHCPQAKLWMQITTAGYAPARASASQILGLPILGWWGRLAFPPPRCLSAPPIRPFFCCVFPSFDPIFPIFVEEDKDVSKNDECFSDQPHGPSIAKFDKLPPRTSGWDTQTLSDVSRESSNAKSPAILEESTKTSNMEVVLQETVLHVQNQFLSRLESMDPLKPESMTMAVEASFGVLDRLSVDYMPFRGRVREFITCASTLADIERPVNIEHSLLELIEQLHFEEVRYRDISRVHDETVAAFTASNQRIQSLREDTSRVKDLLQQVENQLSSWEAETRVLETRASEISRDMLKSQQSLQAVSREAEEAMKLCQKREQERNAAKTALDMARHKLRC